MNDGEAAASFDDRAVNDRRAEVTIAGVTGDLDAVRLALDDAAPKVRSAAYRALVRAGAITAAEIGRAIDDPSPVVRRGICELAGEHCAGGFGVLLDDDDPAVVEAACFAVGELIDQAAVERLAVIATSHEAPLCREGAVAALGAIGDERGRAAVLAALDDTNYIRRRAVVALAAFSGADVDAALEARRTDRDWQVRQAAEDVIGVNRQIGS